jgi:carbon storage regulator
MLVLSRRVGERICIGEGIVVTVVRVCGDKVRLGVEAPSDVAVHREEVFRRLKQGAAPAEEAPGVGAAPG